MNEFNEYDIDYISDVLSLRKPQTESLKILDEIFNEIKPNKNTDLTTAESIIHSKFPIFSSSEHFFLSLTFALATGVGKTRLMGAFITYLYTQHCVKNFLVVAPNKTIYEKLQKDLGVSSSEKYVFKGLGCFKNPPLVISGDDYRDKTISLFDSDVHVFVYNIDKFNSEDTVMHRVNERLGDSFYSYLSKLEDLVVIMDESHNYRAEKGMKALNELHPILGLELTATPFVRENAKQIPFKNVVYDYPLSFAIRDGYTRTPYAITRSDIKYFEFSDDEKDIQMISDGILCHRLTKSKLEQYAINNNVRKVKPFVLIVCRDTSHAEWVKAFIESDSFHNGEYKNKIVVIHSEQNKAKFDEYTKLLLDVERYDNPIEVVIHVDMLKEGWDVNNLYTIIPLRAASSKILREQMVGRGLRLPYGKRTGNKDIDAVMLTAHDKFEEILEEARKGESIFKLDHVIKAEEIEEKKESFVETQTSLPCFNNDDAPKNTCKELQIEETQENINLIKETASIIKATVDDSFKQGAGKKTAEELVQHVKSKLESTDLADRYEKNSNVFSDWIKEKTEETYKQTKEKFIPIPHIRVSETESTAYLFEDFSLDLSQFTDEPISMELLKQNLVKQNEVEYIEGAQIDFEGRDEFKELLKVLKEKPEIDYEQNKDLLIKLIYEVIEHYKKKTQSQGQMKNIIICHLKKTAELIYKQMLQHSVTNELLLPEEIVDVSQTNCFQSYNYKVQCGLYDSYPDNVDITSVLFTGIEKGVFSSIKLDSDPELSFARLIESSPSVVNWLRPAAREFDLTYNHGHHYEPDFVVETKDYYFLVEIKGEDKADDPNVIEKKKRAVKYCSVASEWSRANGYKEWRHLFIPSKEIKASSSFYNLSTRFLVSESMS